MNGDVERSPVVDLTLNGQPVSVDVREGETLLDMLRERFGVTSVKDGCAPEGSCGACTVLVDGRPRVSCAQEARHAEGRAIVTQEGLGDDVRQGWAEAFVASGASQCGFCSPGIVMKARDCWPSVQTRRARRSPAASPGTCADARAT
jgi:xanthine dehydrogenase molybdenum-binding subunit